MAEMTKMASKVLEFLQEQRQNCIDDLKQLDDKRKKNDKQLGAFSYWAGWNLMRYVHDEFALELLENIIENIRGGIKKGNCSDAELVAFLKDVRESYVKRVMQYPGSYSTNQVSNMIEDEKINVYRKLAGVNILDDRSLAGLLKKVE